jgi:nucleoid-associated protein YgaU
MASTAFPRAGASRPAAAEPARRRLPVAWNEPSLWTIVLVVVLIAILGAHARIARLLGTARPTTAPVAVQAPLSAAIAPVSLASTEATTHAPAAAPIATHAPRDPFRALVSSTGARVPAVALPVSNGHALPLPHHGSNGTSTSSPTSTTPAGCAAGHIVQTGDSLWSIAAQHVKETGRGDIDSVWHRIYAANRGKIGDQPSVLPVGIKLCLPTG